MLDKINAWLDGPATHFDVMLVLLFVVVLAVLDAILKDRARTGGRPRPQSRKPWAGGPYG